MTRTSEHPRSVRLRIGSVQLAELGRSEASALFIVVLALAAVMILGLRGGADSQSLNPSSRLAVMDDLTPASVKGLTEAWVAHTGEYAGGMGPNPPQAVEGFQTRPTLVDGLLIVTTTTSKVIALDAETGKEAWRFDPFAGKHVCDFPHRGVAVWSAASGGVHHLFRNVRRSSHRDRCAHGPTAIGLRNRWLGGPANRFGRRCD